MKAKTQGNDGFDWNAKTFQRRMVYSIPDELRAALRELRKAEPGFPDWVFRTRNGTRLRDRNIGRSFEVISRKTGIEGLTPHVLRHTLATELHRRGVPVKVIQKILGHSQLSTTLRYIHTDDQDIAEAMARLPGAAMETAKSA